MNRTKLLKLLVLLASLALSTSAFSEIYRWVDADGKVHFSDKPSGLHDSETVKLRINTYEAVSYETSAVDLGKKVIMYTASWCGVCKRARNYFQDEGIKFTEYDIEKSTRGRHEYRNLGAKGVPVILVGKRRMNGFSIAGFEQLYH